MKSSKRQHRERDAAAGQALAFMIGATVFTVSLGGILLETQEGQAVLAADDGRSTEAPESDSLARALVSNQDVGLASPTSGLDADEVEAWRDGDVTYDEAKKRLGIPDDQEFRLTIDPTSNDVLYETASLASQAACYIGDWEGLSSHTVSFDLDPAVIVADANDALSVDRSAAAEAEINMIESLGFGFESAIDQSAGEPGVQVLVAMVPTPIELVLPAEDLVGSILPDDKQYLEAALPAKLVGDCDHLIVGSNVDQSAMTASVVKTAIESFVLNGGALTVFGSEKANINWLNPHFGSKIENVGATLTAVDTDHPALTTPTELDWSQFDHNGLAWNIDADDEDSFDVALAADGEAVLATSKEAAFGLGQIILTTLRPSDIAVTYDLSEAESLMNNLAFYDDQSSLSLQFGADVPDDVEVHAATRLSTLPDANLGTTPVQVTIWTWRT